MLIKNKVKELRKAEGLSQSSLAEEINVTRATINAIEGEKYNPSLELAFRLSIYFKKDIKDIFYLEKEIQ